MDLACLWVGLLLPLVAALDFKYHHQEEMEAFLKSVAQNYSSITHLHSIGRSVKGRNLWVLVVGRFPKEHKVGVPAFKYVANMHGDETVGRELLLHLIDYLVTNHGKDPEITNLINNTQIHIMPSMNPDGFEAVKKPDCFYSNGRENYNGEDLNRNFPDAFEYNNASRQPETLAVMKWIKNKTFVLSANLHGGALVASYPFDNGVPATGSLHSRSLTPDDDVFQHLAHTYASRNPNMAKGDQCKNKMNFPNGVTNGYSWYPLRGIKGQVFDQNGIPLPNVIVEVQDRKHICPFRTNRFGEYYLLLLPGSYVINVTVPGQAPFLTRVVIPDNSQSYSALKKDLKLPFQVQQDSILGSSSSCPMTPLYKISSHSPTTKPQLFLFLLTLLHIFFK
ncbi:carboxypeptidase M isoform 3-T3 [Ctenodactylus gundi]